MLSSLKKYQTVNQFFLLVSVLSKKLKPNGILTVAHGMSREKINSHHKGSASYVSNGLMPVGILVGIFAKYLTVDMYISDDRMYQVCGRYDNT